MDIYKSSFFLEGIIFIILGLLAIALPTLFTLSAELLFGALILFGGIVQFIKVWQDRGTRSILVPSISALAYIVVGLLFLSRPIIGMMTLTILVMIFFLVSGIFKLALSFQLRQLKGWGWVAFSGICALLLAAVIYSGWPGSAAWTIGILLGIDMLLFGMALLMISFYVRSKPKIP